MRLTPDSLRWRRSARAIVFGVGSLAILGAARLWAEGGPPAVLLALPFAGLGYFLPSVGRAGRRLAARPLVCACLVGALTLIGAAAVTWLCGVPAPAIADEFSYLLAADTFAHGRLTNPPHPMWAHFRAAAILQQPTYMSKYPPAQGLALAVGQVTLGHPIAGVWLSAALACGALTWMLAGWMPGRWAVAGALLAVVHHLTVLWSHNYWGGLVAVFGGALVVGAFGRIVRRRPRLRYAIVLGLGLGILANSRPYEGLVLSAPLLVALGVWMVSRHGPPLTVTTTRIILPLGSMLLVVGAGMLYYNYRGTGDPLTMPYIAYQRSKGAVSLFTFQPPGTEPVYRSEQLHPAYGWHHHPLHAFNLLVNTVRSRATAQAQQFFGTIPLVLAIAVLLPLERSAWHQLAILGLAIFVIGLGLPSWMWSHYAAPAVGLALLITMRVMRRASLWRPGGVHAGRALVAAGWLFMVSCLAYGSWQETRTWRRTGWQHRRVEISHSLSRTGTKHLVMVRYSPRHHMGGGWIYNAADIDAAPVVWAADMDPASNARLFDYFRDRQIWLLEPDRPEITPVPYPMGSRPSLAVAP